MNRDNTSIHVQFSHHGSSKEIFLKSACFRTFSQTKKPNKNILLRIFICQEGFPSSVCIVISSDKFYIFWSDLIMNLLNTDLSCSHISQIAVINAGSHKRHRNVSLYTINSHPRRYKGQNFSNKID